MARDYFIFGETLVSVKGGEHMSGRPIGVVSELGLSTDAIVITPRYFHHDMRIDDFGPDVPADVMWNLADVTIRMNLVHYDEEVLDRCERESMGGGPALTVFDSPTNNAGLIAPAGTILGGNKFLFASGNHFISVNLFSQTNAELSRRYRTCYLAEQPVVFPIGTRASILQLTWRAIPYQEPPSIFNPNVEWISSGAILWDRDLDF